MVDQLSSRYVERHFWRIEELADAVAAPVKRVATLISARCGPEPSYVLGEGGWWSALERDQRAAPPGVAWYSAGAAWGLRRSLFAIRHGATEEQAAAMLAETFRDSFAEALGKIEAARGAFPQCFWEGSVDASAAREAAGREWHDWLDGGYGVCLRVFTGWSCVAKESLGASIKAALASGTYDPARLLIDIEELAGLMLPFAPWQRKAGTPGQTIDRLLNEQALGRDSPVRLSALQ